MTTSRVEVLGHTIAVTDLGPRDGGPPGLGGVVLVHGIGVSGRYFRHLARHLARTRRVLVPDLPGFGASARPGHVLSVEEHAAVVAELVRARGMTGPGTSPPVLLGHSMGAQVVAEVAAREPGLAERVVLVGPVAEPGARSALRQGWRLMRDARRETPAANAVMVTDWLRAGPRRYLATVPSMLAYALEDRLPAVTDPVVLVRGEHDPVCRLDYLELLAGRVPSSTASTVLEVPGEGHIAMFRRPELVADACRVVPCATTGGGAC